MLPCFMLILKFYLPGMTRLMRSSSYQNQITTKEYAILRIPIETAYISLLNIFIIFTQIELFETAKLSYKFNLNCPP